MTLGKAASSQGEQICFKQMWLLRSSGVTGHARDPSQLFRSRSSLCLGKKRRGFVSPCSPSAPPAPWFPGADSGGGRCRHLPAARIRSAAPIHASVELQRHKETCCWSRAQRLSFHSRKSLSFPLPSPPPHPSPAPFLFFSIWLLCKAGGSRWREVVKSKAAAKVHCEEQGKSKECGVVSSVRSVI